MTWIVSTARTRLAKPSHVEWTPSVGQVAAMQSLISSPRKALWADPGAGKTSITLAAFSAIKRERPGTTMLVVAPLRVCQLQWRQEAQQWTQFRHLKIAFLHGPKKAEILREPADIYLINFDGLTWLAKQFRGNLPFDIVCVDESTKIKNHQAERSKALRGCTQRTPYKWMLTGTPNPNGYLDLFGQFLWLDGGAALGKYITHFRDKYFRPAFNGFDYELQRGGDTRIELAIAHLVHRLPFTDLPPLVNDVRWCEFGAEGKRLYKAMDKEQVVVIDGVTIMAPSTGAHQSAKEQMANGAIYKAAGEEEYVAFDDAKLDALDELIEEMNGQPLLVAFQFHHDIERIRKRRGDDIAVLAGGVTAKVAEDIQRRWNAGEIKELYVHPASIGHGLNLQRGGASHVCWFSATFDLELWEQLIRRLWRQGNTASRIVNHILAMKGTIDEDKLAAIEEKSVDQARLLQAMNKNPALPDQKETLMTDKLPTQSGGAWGAPQAPAAPTGWGAPQAPAPATNGWGGSAPQPAPNAAEVANRVTGGWGGGAEHTTAPAPLAPPPAPSPAAGWGQQEGMRHFSPDVQAQVAGLGNGPVTEPINSTTTNTEVAKPKATRTRNKTAADKDPATDTAEPTNASLVGASNYFNVNISISGDRDACVAAIKALAASL